MEPIEQFGRSEIHDPSFQRFYDNPAGPQPKRLLIDFCGSLRGQGVAIADNLLR